MRKYTALWQCVRSGAPSALPWAALFLDAVECPHQPLRRRRSILSSMVLMLIFDSTPVVKPAPKQQRPRAGPRTRSRSPVAGAGEATARTRSPPPLTLPAPLPTPAAVSPPALQTFTATDMMNIGVRFASLDQQAATFRDGLADLRASVTASMEQLNAAINEIREPVDRLALSLRPLLKTSSRFAG